jgi:hypothetical protein
MFALFIFLFTQTWIENVTSPYAFADLTENTNITNTTIRIGSDANFKELNLTNHIFTRSIAVGGHQIKLIFRAFTPSTAEI